MADPIISISYNDKAVRDRLQELQRKVGDLTPAMKSIGEQLLLSTDIRFEKEVDPSGRPWKPNSTFTISKKKRENKIQKILQSSGRLRASLSYSASADKVVVGTNVSYAAKHQLGQGRIPKREFLGVSKEDQQEILLIIDEFLAE